MKACASRTTVEEVEISDQELSRLLRATLRMKFDLPTGAFVKDGWVWKDEEVSYGSHSSFEQTKHRAEQTDDAVLCKILSAI